MTTAAADSRTNEHRLTTELLTLTSEPAASLQGTMEPDSPGQAWFRKQYESWEPENVGFTEDVRSGRWLP